MAQPVQKLETQQRDAREAAVRLRAPQHLTTNRFEEHHKIEGYEQDREVPDFYGCDRLWKLETIHGRIQMGYDPKRGQSFLFANLKTSILGSAAAREQQQMNERDRMRTLKSGTQNLAYSARRRQNSSVLLYKAENKPWSEQSIAPYLQRINLETLAKTMPFLVKDEAAQLEQARVKRRALAEQEREALQQGNAAALAQLRAEAKQLSRWMEELQTLRTLKAQQSHSFFRKINIAIDLQKAKMFDYYRRIRAQRAPRNEAAQSAPLNGENNRHDDADAKQRDDN